MARTATLRGFVFAALLALLALAGARADGPAAPESKKDAAAALKKARAEAQDLLRKIGLASEEKKRADLVARFDALDFRASFPVLLEGLKPDRAPGVQRFAVERVKGIGPKLASRIARYARVR